jgi:hypothetical protein
MKKYYLFLTGILCVAVNAQSVSGVVRDAAGRGIENALVCQANNPSVFKKTDASGAYTIAGNSATALRIGALGFKTVKSTTSRNINMEVDPLLATDIFHISFDNLRAGNTYTEAELKRDFKSANGKGFFDGSAGSDRASVDYNVSKDPNGVSLKVKFPKGKLKTSDSGIDCRIPLKNSFKDNDFSASDIYVSYWVKFSDNYEFDKCGGKLPSLGGSNFNSRENTWKGRIMWRRGGAIQFYMELPSNSFSPDNEDRFWGPKVKNGKGLCQSEFTPHLSTSKWHNIELHYKFETPGKNDGVFEGWVDGKFYSINASVFNNYRPVGSARENITVNAILLSAFLGGSDANYEPSQDTFAWFDEIRVSNKRINDFASGRNGDFSDEVNSKREISVRPNPSTGIFNLEETAQWSVYDALGKTVLEGKSQIIDLSANPKGLYFLKVNDENMKKIIVQ